MDREKVIKRLRELHGSKETMELISDTISLLKEQQPKPVAYPETNYQGFPVSHCPTCNECIDRKAYGCTKQQNFCPYCGQAVKWD